MGKRKYTKKQVKKMILEFLVVLVIALIITTIESWDIDITEKINKIPLLSHIEVNTASNIDLDTIPEYSGKAYIEINNNKPYFEESEYTTKAFEKYSELDSLGRCGVAYANICEELMPTGKRESIGSVKPSGWNNKSYPGLVDGDYLYNRCHLIGYQLAGENANPKNLITCTRTMNAKTMLEFENKVANYVKKTNNHVLYRVTPIYDGVNLLATGVTIEASSVEDHCKDICFNVFVYNVEDGVKIDYKDGTSTLVNEN